MSVREEVTIAVVDVETTGLLPRRGDRIIEIAVVLIGPDGSSYGEYETLLNPGRDLGPTRIHGITAAEVLLAPTFSQVAGEIAEILNPSFVMAGHNVSFDRNFLAAEFDRIGIAMPEFPVICTCRLLGRQKLKACCEEFGIRFLGEHHRAIVDARNTAALVHRLLEEEVVDWESLTCGNGQWPVIPQTKATRVTRDHARQKIEEPPAFLQRVASKISYDVEGALPQLLDYLGFLDRVLEDRSISADENFALEDIILHSRLTLNQLEAAHRMYLQYLAVAALADGLIAESERSDLHLVARLLGLSGDLVDQMLNSAQAQLRTSQLKAPISPTREGASGKSVCFTGELQSRLNAEPISRSLASVLAEKAGLTVKNSVTKKLDFLVVADPNTQSGKAKKARQYGTRILADTVFWRMIGVNAE